jgi:hypothetical protein
MHWGVSSGFERFRAVGTYEGQGNVMNVHGAKELTLVDTVHLERPPGNFLMSIEPLAVEISDPGDFALKMSHEEIEGLTPSAANLPVGCVNFFEGAETRHDEWVLPFVLCLFGLMGRIRLMWRIYTEVVDSPWMTLVTFCDLLDKT